MLLVPELSTQGSRGIAELTRPGFGVGRDAGLSVERERGNQLFAMVPDPGCQCGDAEEVIVAAGEICCGGIADPLPQIERHQGEVLAGVGRERSLPFPFRQSGEEEEGGGARDNRERMADMLMR